MLHNIHHAPFIMISISLLKYLHNLNKMESITFTCTTLYSHRRIGFDQHSAEVSQTKTLKRME